MRLNKCVQVAVGLVAGGSVVIILNGSALAASNSQDTVIQNGQSRSVPHSGGQSALQPQGGGVSGQTGDSGQDQTLPADSSGGGVSTSNSSPGQPVTGTDGSTSGPASQTTQATTSSTSQTVTAPAKSKGSGTGGAAGSAGSGQVALANNGTVAASTPSEVAVIAPAPTSTTAAPVRHTTLLRIQPVITNRGPDAQDLAAAVPSAPAPARAPNPAKSSGLLGSLVVGLAGIVVPQPLVPPVDIVQRVMLPVSLGALVVLLLNVFLFSYGLWLRRGGFATAARSDAPSAGASSFATPLLLGYVTSPPDLHSPILMVAETKTSNQFVRTAFRKEVMR